MEEFYTTRQIAKALHVNIITVRRWIENGKIPTFKFGRYYRIKKSDFDHFIEERRVKK